MKRTTLSGLSSFQCGADNGGGIEIGERANRVGFGAIVDQAELTGRCRRGVPEERTPDRYQPISKACDNPALVKFRPCFFVKYEMIPCADAGSFIGMSPLVLERHG
jgi:hypothetical protein